MTDRRNGAARPGKFFAASKTLWGGVLLALPAFSEAFGLAVSPADWAGLEEAGTKLINAVEAVVGAVLVVWGRLSATRPIALAPRRRSPDD